MIGKKEIKMKRIATVSFFGIALALVLSFGIPGNANAFDNGTNGRIILAGVEAGFDILGVGAGVGIGDGGVDAGAHVGGAGAGVDIGGSGPNSYERERAYERDRAAAHKRAADQKRDADRNRENSGAQNSESTDR